MSSLYELTENYLTLQELDPEGDENYLEAIENSLAEVKESFNDKAINIIKVEGNIKAEITAMKDLVTRIQSRIKVKQNKIDNLRNYLKGNMIETGINKIECEYFSISLRNTKASVIIDNEKEVPQKYVDTSIVEEVAKNRLYGDLKAGVEVPGCHLQKNKSLIIK